MTRLTGQEASTLIRDAKTRTLSVEENCRLLNFFVPSFAKDPRIGFTVQDLIDKVDAPQIGLKNYNELHISITSRKPPTLRECILILEGVKSV